MNLIQPRISSRAAQDGARRQKSVANTSTLHEFTAEVVAASPECIFVNSILSCVLVLPRPCQVGQSRTNAHGRKWHSIASTALFPRDEALETKNDGAHSITDKDKRLSQVHGTVGLGHHCGCGTGPRDIHSCQNDDRCIYHKASKCTTNRVQSQR